MDGETSPTSTVPHQGGRPPWARRLTLIGCCLVFGAYLVMIAAASAESRRSVERGGPAAFVDFTPIYAASLQLMREPAENLFHLLHRYYASVEAAQLAYDGRLSRGQAHAIGEALWMHPPIFMLFILPLALLPHFAAYVGWLAVTAVPYVSAMRAIQPGAAGWAMAMASPPVFYNLILGQTGFLSAGLIGLGLAQLHRRPVLAGLYIGLASFKPHFGVLIPLALVLGGHWRTFAAASATVIGLVLASVTIFGPKVWLAYAGASDRYIIGFAEGFYNLDMMATPIGAVLQLGVSPTAAWTVQLAAAAVGVAAVVSAWRRPAAPGLQAAVLCCATLLAVPMAYLYDLVLLVPAAGWLWQDMQARGAPVWQRAVLLAALAAILPAYSLAEATGLVIAPAVVATLLLLALIRLRRPCRAGNEPVA